MLANHCVAKNCEAYKSCCFECKGSIPSDDLLDLCIALCEEFSCKKHPDYTKDEDQKERS